MTEDLDLEAEVLEQLELASGAFELIEFSLDRTLPTGEQLRGRYGVNVAKVREVVRMPKINPLGTSVPGVAGIFELRGVPIPAVVLTQVLGDPTKPVTQSHQIIVVEFSGKRAGFVVDCTHRIRRVAWQKVLPPSGDEKSFMTGMILLDQDEFLFILDLEKIITEMEVRAGNHKTSVHAPIAAPAPGSESRINFNGRTILIVDDSPLMLDTVEQTLRAKGFQILRAENGQIALKILEQVHTEGQEVSLVVTDFEMPQMDGLGLTKAIRGHQDFNDLPIIFHSSLSGDASIEAGANAGANGYVIKNDMNTLLEMIGKILKMKLAA